MKEKSLLKPLSHRFLHDYDLSKHVPVAFATFLRWERVLTNWKWRKYCKKGFEKLVSSQKLHNKGFIHLNSFQFSNFQILEYHFSNFAWRAVFYDFFSVKRQHTWFSCWWQNWIFDIIMCAFPANAKWNWKIWSQIFEILENWKSNLTKIGISEKLEADKWMEPV